MRKDSIKREDLCKCLGTVFNMHFLEKITCFSMKAGIGVGGALDLQQHQVHEVPNVFRIEGPLVLRDVRLDEVLQLSEGLKGLVDAGQPTEDRPLGHGRVGQDRDDGGGWAVGLPQGLVEQLDDPGQLGVLQLQLLTDHDGPERVEDAHVHGSVKVDRFILERSLA